MRTTNMRTRSILILVVFLLVTSGFSTLRVLSHPARPSGAAAVMGSAARDIGHLTRMELRAVPREYRGPCPKVIRFIGEITFDGPGRMVYNVERSDRARLEHGRELSFARAERKRVEETWEIGKSYTGWVELASGNMRSNRAEFRVECTR
jgi:hypothetical protein